MNIVHTAQIVGLIGFLILLCIKFYILIDKPSFLRFGRIAGLWLWIYLFFLVILRLLNLINLTNMDQLTVIAGFSTIIPLIGLIVHILFSKKIGQTSV